MPTEKQIRAARTNGALSRGPVTEQGKRNSARNSTRHGLLAQTIVLDEEVTGPFQEILDGLMAEYQPSTASQVAFVNIMAAAQWRLIRIWGLQKTGMDRDMALQDPAVGPAPIRALIALQGSSGGIGAQELLRRYEITYDRQFSRALTRLLELQALPGNRQPDPYNPASPAGPTWKEAPEPQNPESEAPEQEAPEQEAPERQEPKSEDPEPPEPDSEEPESEEPEPAQDQPVPPSHQEPDQTPPNLPGAPSSARVLQKRAGADAAHQQGPEQIAPAPVARSVPQKPTQRSPGPSSNPPSPPAQDPSSGGPDRPEKSATARRTQQGDENK